MYIIIRVGAAVRETGEKKDEKKQIQFQNNRPKTIAIIIFLASHNRRRIYV